MAIQGFECADSAGTVVAADLLQRRYQKAKSLLKRCLKIYQERGNESRTQEVRAELYDKWGKPKEMAALDTSATVPR